MKTKVVKKSEGKARLKQFALVFLHMLRRSLSPLLRHALLRAAPRVPSGWRPRVWQPPLTFYYRDFSAKKGVRRKAARTEAPRVDDEPDDDASSAVVDVERLREDIDGAVSQLSAELSTLRGGRADPSMFDHVRVEAYGGSQPLSALAQATMKSAQTAVITVYDPTLAESVRAALAGSGLNLNPILEGHTLTVPVPKPSRETRDALTKVARKHGENAKQRLRRVRKDALDTLKAAKKKRAITEDELRALSADVDSAVEAGSKRTVELVAEKEANIMAG